MPPAAAIGVMATVSAVELWWHSAVEQHDFLGISAAVAAGAVLFAVLDPLLPKHEEAHHEDSKNQPETAAVAAADGSPGATDQVGMKKRLVTCGHDLQLTRYETRNGHSVNIPRRFGSAFNSCIQLRKAVVQRSSTLASKSYLQCHSY
jgi:hypothetical protein